MSHALVLPITRSHDFPCVTKSMSSRYRLPRGLVVWNLLVAAMTVAFSLLYVFRVNTASANGYALRKMETRVENLKTETTILQNQVVQLSSVHALSARARSLGFVPADRLEFVNPASQSYAMR